MVRPRHDRWLLSYADFVTLLFAVFVVLYAANRTHTAKPAAPVSTPVPSPSNFHSNLLTDLQSALRLEQARRQVTISTDPRGVVLALDEHICFLTGQAEVEPTGLAIFEKVGRSLTRYPNHVLLVGHTDAQPIHNAQFESNWELSSARSIAVMHLMQRAGGLQESRFLIQGSASQAPIAGDDSEAGRAQNRRVDIVILDGDQHGAFF